MKSFQINGTVMAGDQRGSGETLVFIHGAVGDFRTWENQVNDFATHYQVISYSRRWHYPQTCDGNGTNYTPEVHVADLLSLLSQVGPAHLVAHSYGAAVSAVVAIQKPELVKSLVLAEPSLFSLLADDPDGFAALQAAFARTPHLASLIARGEREAALHDFLEVILADGQERLPLRARQVMLDNLHTLLPMLNGINSGAPFTIQHAALIRVPTLLVGGENSPLIFRRTMEILGAAVPHAQRVILPGVSHGLHLEHPKAFSRVAREFLTKLDLILTP